MLTVLLISLLGVYQSYCFYGDSYILQARNPATGPCTLNRIDKLKCDENGYYKTVQCNTYSCFCVTPHTALIAYDTRTGNPRTAPKCGTCIVYLQQLFANGDLPENSFIPKCDVARGNFEPAQCDIKRNQCYCVDPNTGIETPGSRKPMTGLTTMKCMQIDFAIDELSFPTFVKPITPTPSQEDGMGRPYCAKNRDAGHYCTQNKTSIRYYFDVERFECYPFEHKGCGGNENSFSTTGECYSDCIQLDYSQCAMKSQPARGSSGQYYICPNRGPLPPPGTITTTTPGPIMTSDGCPKGYVCQMGAFFGTCCDENLTNRVQAANKPTCRNKKRPYQSISGDYSNEGDSDPMLGKSCSDNFCPRTHTCERNEFFAYCCPK